MYSHQNNFAKAFDWTQKLRRRYLHTLAGFRIYERFRKLAAPNIIGKKKANANAALFSNYVYFFTPLQESARCYFFVELAKFFDENKHEQSLTIELLLQFVKKNLHSFSKEEFLKYHSKRIILPQILEYYTPLTIKDVQRMEARLKRNEKLIKNLKVYRDKNLVHDDLKKEEIKITGLQIRILLKIIQSIIDLFCLKLDFSSNIYSNYDKEPVFAVDRVVNALQEHERECLEGIKKKYEI